MRGLRRVIVWARGDPESIRVARALKGILEEQGLQLILAERGSEISCDVLVEPPDERELELLDLRVEARERVRERDPWRAAFKALFPQGPRVLRIGIDPGLSCAMAAYAEGILIWAERLACEEVGRRVSWLVQVTGAAAYRINLGAGEGYEAVAEELLRSGHPFALVPEEGTSKRRSLGAVKDKDISAAASLALRMS
ncbi:MAG: hypothetical protein N3F67_05090 [Acidilobaceae archaeon]|nr:hypothetical protein [Acidilobaceae archaeon]